MELGKVTMEWYLATTQAHDPVNTDLISTEQATTQSVEL